MDAPDATARLPDPPLPSDALALVALDVAQRTGRLDALFDGPQAVVAFGATLAHVLIEAGVADRLDGDRIALQPAFRAAWAGARADLAARLAFQRGALADIVTRMERLCFDVPAFMRDSATFGLFRYDRAMTEAQDDIAHTRRWVAYVEALSRHEAPALAPRMDLSGVVRLLEVGGNTGIMAEALLDAHPGLSAVVMDLPAVCALGRARAGGVAGLSFVAADARSSDWRAAVGPFQAVLFKSVLHDWPEAEATGLLDRAVQALPPGGRIVIAERGALAGEAGQGLRATDAANLVFAPFYRDPSFYERALAERGCTVRRVDLRLDMAWHVVTGALP